MAKRRANGEGCIYKRSNDARWVGQYTVSPGVRKSVYGKTQQEVRTKLKEALWDMEIVSKNIWGAKITAGHTVIFVTGHTKEEMLGKLLSELKIQ